MTNLTIEAAQEIYGDSEAIKRGYVTQASIDAANTLAKILTDNGFEARDNMAIFPDRFHLTNPIEDSLGRKEAKSLDVLTAYFMSQA